MYRKLQNYRAAKRLQKTLQMAYPDKHRYQVVNPAHYPHVDLQFYEDNENLLTAKGFIKLGDYTVVSLNFQTSAPTFIRALVSRDKTVLAGIYQFLTNPAYAAPYSEKILDYETELSDGHFIITTNAGIARNLSSPEPIMTLFVDVNLPADQIWQAHVSRVSQYLKANPNITPRLIKSLEEVYSLNDRMTKIKSDYRQVSGGIPLKEELERLRNNPAITEIFAKKPTAETAANKEGPYKKSF
jgi:hypothetical protein